MSQHPENATVLPELWAFPNIQFPMGSESRKPMTVRQALWFKRDACHEIAADC